MGTAFNPAKTSPASWDAFSDVDAFVDAVLAELAAMAADGTRSTRSGPKPPLTGAALRKAILAIWCQSASESGFFQVLCDQPEVEVPSESSPERTLVSTRRGSAILEMSFIIPDSSVG
jgi:hypothetical protein